MTKGRAIPTDNIPFIPSAEVEASKAPNVSFDPSKLTLKPCNHIANFDIPPKIKNYEQVVNYLKCSPIFKAITRDPDPMYLPYLFELWYTIQWVEGAQHSGFVGTINNGKVAIEFGLNRFRKALGLDYKPKDFAWEAPIGDKESKSVITLIDYESESKSKVAVARGKMSGEWSYFFGHIIQCLGTSVGSYDQANGIQRQIAHALITGKQIDIAHLIYNDLHTRVKAKERDPAVPYPRFLSLIIKRIMKKEYGINPAGEMYGGGAMYPVAQVGKQIFLNKPAFRTTSKPDGTPSTTTLPQVMLQLIPEGGPPLEETASEDTGEDEAREENVAEEEEAANEPISNPASSVAHELNAEQISNLISSQKNQEL